MLVIKFIYNIDNTELRETFDKLVREFSAPNVACITLDTGSKKDIKEALAYFSKYASTETFVVIETDEPVEEKVLGVVYKESVKQLEDWKILIKERIKTTTI